MLYQLELAALDVPGALSAELLINDQDRLPATRTHMGPELPSDQAGFEPATSRKWSYGESNSGSPQCECGALPVEP